MAFPPALARHCVGALVLTLLGNVVTVATSLAQTRSLDVPQQARTITVQYADLNLSSEEGTRLLYKRLVWAAERVCPERSDSVLALKANQVADRCVADAVERAVQQIKNPRLAEVAAAAQKR
jgi:UrcA family protein